MKNYHTLGSFLRRSPLSRSDDCRFGLESLATRDNSSRVVLHFGTLLGEGFQVVGVVVPPPAQADAWPWKTASSDLPVHLPNWDAKPPDYSTRCAAGGVRWTAMRRSSCPWGLRMEGRWRQLASDGRRGNESMPNVTKGWMRYRLDHVFLFLSCICGTV